MEVLEVGVRARLVVRLSVEAGRFWQVGTRATQGKTV